MHKTIYEQVTIRPQHVVNPSIAAQMAAVTNYPASIQYIKNPCEDAQMHAISINTGYLEYINNPTLSVMLSC